MSGGLHPRDLGTILGVWAHPDDEAYLSAGLMALARDNGQRVVVATATAGERGSTDPDRWPPQRLADIRREELAASLACVGVAEHHWLGYADGGCAAVSPATGARRIGELIEEVRPDTVLTFGPDGMTGHADHRAVSQWTTDAWRADGRRTRLLHAAVTPEFLDEWGPLDDELGIYVDGVRPPGVPRSELAVHLPLPDHVAVRKLAALRAQASQTTAIVEALGVDRYRRWWSTESFAAADRRPNGQPRSRT